MPGSTPATSQLDWLISTTAITVLSWSKATRDLLKSFGWGIRALHQLVAATMVPSPRRLPHTISPLEQRGFQPSVPGHAELCCRAPRSLLRGAGGAEVGTAVQPDFFCSASHSIEPGAYTVLVGCGLRRCSGASASRWYHS